MRSFALLLAATLIATTAPAAGLDIPDLLRKSQDADDRNALAERNYVFEQRTETRTVDGNGKIKSKEVETYETIINGGRPYQRLIGKDDKPLSADRERREREKQEKEVRDRARETPAQREKALATEEEHRRKNRELAHETLNAFDFRLAGEDADNWILEATPRPGYRTKTRETAILKHFKGRIWISRKDFVWTRFDAEAIDNISFGFVLARLEKGAHIQIERRRVNDEVWLPQRIGGGGAGRIALVKKLRIEFETTCRNYRKFSSDSRLVADPPGEVK